MCVPASHGGWRCCVLAAARASHEPTDQPSMMGLSSAASHRRIDPVSDPVKQLLGSTCVLTVVAACFLTPHLAWILRDAVAAVGLPSLPCVTVRWLESASIAVVAAFAVFCW